MDAHKHRCGASWLRDDDCSRHASGEGNHLNRPSFLRGASPALVVVFLILFVSSTGCNREKSDSLRLTADGVEYYKAGRFTQAVKAFREASAVWDANHKAHYFAGMILLHQFKDIDSAESHLRKAVELYDTSPEYHYQYGVALSEAGRVGEAMDHFRRTLRNAPDHSGAHFRIGKLYEVSNKLDQAVEEYTAAIQGDPRFGPAYAALAALYSRFDKNAQAEQVLDNCVRNCPAYPECHHDLGLVMSEAGRTEEAVKHFLAALKVKPDYTSALFNLGMAYRSLGDRPRAKQYLERYLGLADKQQDTDRIDMAYKVILGFHEGN